METTKTTEFIKPRIAPPPTLMQLVSKRMGWDDEFFKQTETPSKTRLKDLDKLLDYLKQVRDLGCQITISPDYDMDGITSGMILYAGLAQLGFHVNLQIPNYKRGHEFSAADVHEIMRDYPSTKAIITCDSGINSHDGVATAINDYGLLMLVTDHHIEKEPGCKAHAFVDPARMDEDYELTGICGAFVAYTVIIEFAKKFDLAQIDTLEFLSLFAGLGTVADVMPLVGENRLIVKKSFAKLNILFPPDDYHHSVLNKILDQPNIHPVFRTAFLGFEQMLSNTPYVEKPLGVNSDFYGFSIAPMFNATRRVEGNMEDCFGLFINADKNERLECLRNLCDNNKRRKIVATEDTIKLLNDKNQVFAPFVYQTDTPLGMLGLLANNILETRKVPAVVGRLSPDGSFAGSGRSPEGFNLDERLGKYEGITVQGHANACGIKADDVNVLFEALQTEFEDFKATRKPAEETIALRIGPSKNDDVTFDEIEKLKTFIIELSDLGPFGQGLKPPKILASVDLNDAEISRFGANGSQAHLKIALPNDITLFWFYHFDEIESSEKLATFEVSLNLEKAYGTNLDQITAFIQKQVV